MRVYLPSTLSALAELARTGELGPAPLRGYAVTGALRDAYGDSDDEELEYFATTLAAEDSLQLQTAPSPEPVASPVSPASPAPPAPRVSPASPAPLVLRRVVVAADLPDAQVTAESDPLGAISLSGPIPRSTIAAFHVDDPDFVPDPADPEATADQELLWYAAQELRDLLEP